MNKEGGGETIDWEWGNNPNAIDTATEEKMLEKEKERLESITIQDVKKMVLEKDLPKIIEALENSGIDATNYDNLKGNIALKKRMKKSGHGRYQSGMSSSLLKLAKEDSTENQPISAMMNARYRDKKWKELYKMEAPAIKKLELVGTMNKSDIQPIVDYFHEGMNNKSEEIWHRSIRILGFIGDEKIVKAFSDILKHQDECKYIEYDFYYSPCDCEVSKNSKCETVVNALGPLYKRTKDQRIAQACINALGDKSIIYTAAKNLGEIGNKNAVKPLIKVISALEYDDSPVGDIVDALSEIESELQVYGNGETIIVDLIKLKEKGTTNIDLALEGMNPKDVGIEYEKLEMYEVANEWYNASGLLEEAARVRKLKAEQGAVKVDQTVIHGDYVDDRDTIVKDSVINRSNVGGGSDDKIAKLEKIAEMKDKGIIDDDEFKQMKKEILGK